MEKLLLLGAHLEGHADNIAPALLGGLQVVVQDGEQLVHVGLPVPAGLKVVLFVPELVMPTRESRRLLPLNLTRADAVYNIGRAALLLAAATSGQWDALGTAMQDRLHQPARSQLFPAMYPLFDAARQAGAFGAYLSGGGSTIAAWVDETGADRVAQALAEAAARMEVAGSVRIAGFSQRGGYIDSVE
jgi:homoserine kinase